MKRVNVKCKKANVRLSETRQGNRSPNRKAGKERPRGWKALSSRPPRPPVRGWLCRELRTSEIFWNWLLDWLHFSAVSRATL